MPKILILTNKLTRGGAEAIVVEHCNALCGSNYNVRLGLLRSTEKKETFYENLNILESEIVHFNIGSIFNPLNFLKIFYYIKYNNFDLVMTHLFESNLLGRIASILAGVPTIVSVEHSVYFNKKKWQKWFDHILAKYTTIILGVSEEVVVFTSKQEGISLDKFRVLPQLVNPNLLGTFSRDDIFRRFNIKNDSLVVLTISRFSSEKGVEKILDIARICKQKLGGMLPFKFLLVGYGLLEKKLEDGIVNMGLSECVEIIKDPNQAKEYLVGGDIFLLTSSREGVPVAMLEAMANGLLPVASNVGGVPSVVQDGINGFLLDKDNIEGFADTIISLSKNKDVLQKLRLEAKDRAYECMGTSEDFVGLIDSLINQKG